MNFWNPFARRSAPLPILTASPIDRASAARELGRLGGQAIGARRHAESEARHHAERELIKAKARRMRADCCLRPLPILEPTELKGA